VSADQQDAPHGVLQSTVEVFLDSTRALVDLATRTGAAGARAVVPAPALDSVNRMLVSMRSLAEQAPPLSAEIDVLVDELHAKRLSIQAITAELTVLDQQLEILERTLGPVQQWSSRWQEIQHALLHLEVPTKPST
jgi:hypothetical protein